jgi:hypothetical protein
MFPADQPSSGGIFGFVILVAIYVWFGGFG